MKPQRNPKGTHMTWTSEVPTCSKHHANERLKCQHVANTVQNGRQTWQHVAHTIQSGRWYAKMWQIPCKMTGSSSKLLQIQGKWHQEFEQKNTWPKKQTNIYSSPLNSIVLWFLRLKKTKAAKVSKVSMVPFVSKVSMVPTVLSWFLTFQWCLGIRFPRRGS